MQLMCVAEVTPELNIKLSEKIRSMLHPGERIRIKIESLDKKKEEKRQRAISCLKGIGSKSRLGLKKKTVSREDAHLR